METPFYERYPSKFKEKDGAPVFKETIYTSEFHDKYLSENYFPLVMQVNTFPRYKNKREMDPQVKMFLDETNTELKDDWGLPKPNPEAAFISMAKYAKDVLPMTEEQVRAMNKAWSWTERQFGPYMGDSSIRNLDEAKLTIDMTTSSGFPWNVHYPKKIDLWENFPEIDEWLEQDWINLAVDDNWTTVWKSSLKEELRTKEKIARNSIRTFTASAVDATVHGNRLFGDMNDKMNKAFLNTASCIGMSPLLGNWNRLYRKLNVFKHGYALDEKEYDSSLRVFLMWGCAQFRWKMLKKDDKTEENRKRIKTFYRNLINSLILTPDGILVMKLTGNPSGSPNTVNDNTLILYTIMSYAWIINNPDKESTYTDFELCTAKALVGDDNTWTVSDTAHEFYNAKTVIATWATLGITTTTDSIEPRIAEDLDFLSAHTVFLRNMAVPTYERAKLMTSLLYAKSEHLTPAKTMERLGGLTINGWTDLPMRKFCRDFYRWLIYKYDKTCAEDPDWITAKAGILNDYMLEKLYLGESIALNQQGYSETKERLISRIKMSSRTNKNPEGRRTTGGVNNTKVTQKKKAIMAARVNKPVIKTTNKLPPRTILKKDPVKAAQYKNNPRMQPRMQTNAGRKIGESEYSFKEHKEHEHKLEKRIAKLERDKREKEKPEKEDSSWWETALDIGSTVVPHLLPLLLGAGDYEDGILQAGDVPETNSLLAAASNGQEGTSVPYMHTTGERTRVVHREYIGDVYSSTEEFSTVTFAVNPGMNESFPWLSPIANQYTSYDLKGMVYEFVSEGSEYTNSVGLGYVAIGAQYNAGAPIFVDKRDMLNSQFATSAKPSKSFQAWIECKRGGTPMDQLYIRGGQLPANSDIRMYDHCNVTLAVGGHTAGDVIIGELWCTYDVEVLLPKSSETAGVNLLYNNTAFPSATIDGSNHMTLGPLTSNTKNTFNVTQNGNTIILPNYVSGDFMIYVNYITTTTFGPLLPVPPTITASSEIESFSLFYILGQVFVAGYQNTFQAQYKMTTYGLGGTLTWEMDGVLDSAGVITMNFTIFQLPREGVTSQVLDKHGKNRSKKYNDMMKKLILPEPETPYVSIRRVEPYDLQTNNKFNRIAFEGDRVVYHEVNDATFQTMIDLKTSDATVKLVCSQLFNVSRK